MHDSSGHFLIRAIRPSDDAAIADIIRSVMTEFGASGPGFAIHDPEVSGMSHAYSQPRRAYFAVEANGRVGGGGGFAPLDAADPDICELRKMYFLPQLRGQGAGRALIAQCLEAARSIGFRRCYLETLTGMDSAAALYEKFGFRRLPGALGATGHFGCNRFYMLDL